MKAFNRIVFCAALLGGGISFAGTSATSEFFTVDTAKFAIDDVTSPYCSGAYNAGKKATFLSGVKCQVVFDVKITVPETRKVDYLLVNTKKVSSASRFTLNVGTLSPGGKIEVVAVDKNGGKTDPFRVNVDIASTLPWTNGGTAFTASEDEARGKVVYYSTSFSAFFWMDALSQLYEIADKEFPLNVTPSFKVGSTFESDTAQYTTGLSAGLTRSGVKDNWFSTIKKQPLCKFAGAQITGTLSGGPVSQWNPQTLRWEDAGGTLGISAEGKVDLISFRIPQTLYLVYVRMGLDAQGSLAASWNGNGEWSGEIGFDPLLGGHGKVGAGLEDALCVEGSATGGLFLKGQFPKDPGYVKELGFGVSASWKTVFFGIERDWNRWEKTYIWYPRNRAETSVSEQALKRMLAAAPGQTTGGEQRLVRRNYRKTRTANRRLLSAGTDSTSLGDGYPYPAPAIAMGDRDLLAYLRDNEGRLAINRTELVCRTGTEGRYDEPVAIWDDGTADFMPSISQNASGLAVAAWANAKSVYGDDDFDALYSGMEIAVAVRDAETGEWMARNLTDDDSLDMTPKVAVAGNGSAAVAWIKNTGNDAMGSKEMPSSLYVSHYRNGVWTAARCIVSGAGLVHSFDLAYDGSTTTVVYSKDKDGAPQTEDDGEVWYASVPQSGTVDVKRLSAKDKNAVRPFVWYAGTKLRTIFLQDGKLMKSEKLAAASAVPVAETVPLDYGLLKGADGSALLTWSVQKEGAAGDDVYSLAFDKSGTVGAATTLLVPGGDTLARKLTGGVADDGSLRLAYERVAVSYDSNGWISYGDVDLVALYREPKVDVGFSANAISFASDPEPGQNATVLVRVSNFTAKAARNVAVSLWRGVSSDETRVCLGTVNVDMAALSSVKVPFAWNVEQGLGEIAFEAMVDEEDILGDADRENNSTTWHPSVDLQSLVLRNGTSAKTSALVRTIGVQVFNPGLVTDVEGATVRFWRGGVGGTLLGTYATGAVASGDDAAVNLWCDWNLASMPMTAKVERVVVELVQGASHPLFAVEVEGDVWSLILDAQGGTLSESALKVTKGGAAGALPVPVRSGWRFIGWYTMPEAGEEVTAETTIVKDLTLYAHWVKVYTVTFNANGGKSPEGRRTIDAGLTLDELPVPTRKNYIFQGWYTAKSKGTRVTEERVVSANATFYARWAVAVTVTLNPQGGALSGTNKFTIVKNKTLGTLETPVKTGYTLKGWYTAKSGGKKMTAKTKVAKSATWYARWTAKKYPVAVVKEGNGTVSGAGSKAYKSKVTLTAKASKGYVFQGWYASNGAFISQKASYALTVPLDGATYTAKFVTAAEDKASIGMELLGVGFGASAGTDETPVLPIVTNICGVMTTWPVSATALTPTSVTVKGQPKGLAYDKTKGAITGVPSVADKSGTMTVTVKSTGGSQMWKIPWRTVALPAFAKGTFNGVTLVEGELGAASRLVTLNVTATGKITAKIGSLSLTRTGWTIDESGRYTAKLTDTRTVGTGKKAKKYKDVLMLSLDPEATWTADQVSGLFTTALTTAPDVPKNADLTLTARQNVFASNAEAKMVAAGFDPPNFTFFGVKAAEEGCGYVYDLAADEGVGLYAAIKKANGIVTLSGKIGKTKVSGTATLAVSEPIIRTFEDELGEVHGYAVRIATARFISGEFVVEVVYDYDVENAMVLDAVGRVWVK